MLVKEIAGALNGVTAEEGTVIGVDHKSGRFLVVIQSIPEIDYDCVIVGFATDEDLRQIGQQEPRSVTEHLGIQRRETPFGLARVVGASPHRKITTHPAPNYLQQMRDTERAKRNKRRIMRAFKAAYVNSIHERPPVTINRRETIKPSQD